MWCLRIQTQLCCLNSWYSFNTFETCDKTWWKMGGKWFLLSQWVEKTMKWMRKSKRSCLEVLCKRRVFKKLQNPQQNTSTCVRFNRVTGISPVTLCRCFHLNFVKFSGGTTLQNFYEWLLLKIMFTWIQLNNNWPNLLD